MGQAKCDTETHSSIMQTKYPTDSRRIHKYGMHHISRKHAPPVCMQSAITCFKSQVQMNCTLRIVSFVTCYSVWYIKIIMLGLLKRVINSSLDLNLTFSSSKTGFGISKRE